MREGRRKAKIRALQPALRPVKGAIAKGSSMGKEKTGLKT